MLQVNVAQIGACETVLLSGPYVIKLQNIMAESWASGSTSQVGQKSVTIEGNDFKMCAPKIPPVGSKGKKFKKQMTNSKVHQRKTKIRWS